MALIQLIAVHESEYGTRDFANAVCSALNLSGFHERESSHYDEGFYFQGKYGEIVVNISLSESEYPDLPYWISVRDQQTSEDDLNKIVETSIIPRLIANGFHLARLEPFGRSDEVRIDY